MYKIIAVSLLLIGCAPAIIGGNQHGVTLDRINNLNVSSAYSTAEKHCAKYDREAKLTIDSGSSMTFDCIPK